MSSKILQAFKFFSKSKCYTVSFVYINYLVDFWYDFLVLLISEKICELEELTQLAMKHQSKLVGVFDDKTCRNLLKFELIRHCYHLYLYQLFFILLFTHLTFIFMSLVFGKATPLFFTNLRSATLNLTCMLFVLLHKPLQLIHDMFNWKVGIVHLQICTRLHLTHYLGAF